MILLGVVWWVIALLVVDFFVLGWLIRPHPDRYQEDKYWPAWSVAWALIATTAVLWLGGFNLPVWIWNNPMNFFVGAVTYGITGVVWSIIHWWLWRGSEKQRERFKAAYSRWEKQPNVDKNAPKGTLEDFYESEYNPYGWDKDFEMITTWVIFWPLDLFFYLLGDFIFNLATAIGRKLAGIYASIGKGIDKKTIGG